MFTHSYRNIYTIEGSRGAGAQAGDCKRDRLWVRFILKVQYLIFSFLHPGSAMPSEFGEKWGLE